MRPQLWVVAGPNGAGKSTLADRYLAGRLPVVNPDNIAREQLGIGSVQAGKIAIQRQRRHLMALESFAWETTLSGNREVALMREAKDAGYKVNLVFIGVRDPGLSMLRVADRVAAGGHHIPPADVARRFERSLRNLVDALVVADRAYIFDNSGERRRLLLSHEQNQSRHVSKHLPRWIVDALPTSTLQSRGIGH
ncbi:MAG: zeta toxin family protein [Burkholderiales bacterium]|nr:zeta toxin family protein [Burkholderiales bacterium]